LPPLQSRAIGQKSPYKSCSALENMTKRTPIFCVVLKDGEYWWVEAEWPDGTIEEVHKFKTGLDALNWVKTESATWAAERRPNVRR
jgi:hypothetical protein